jgi:toxin ParE1/3/4
MRLHYTSEALAHIKNFYDFIAQDNPRAAAEVIRRIRADASRLRDFPQIGHAGAVRGTLEWVVDGLPYVIVYQLWPEHWDIADEVLILAVFHCKQQR